MRSPVPASCWFFLLGLLSLTAQAADARKSPKEGPPVLISKEGIKTEEAEAAPARISSKGVKPKWTNVAELKRYAAKGDPQACFELGERALYGDEVPQDTKQAVQLMEQAARGGISNAWFRLGKIYHDGLLGAPDYERTLDYYPRAARAGVPEAQHNLGAMLVSARGVKRDLVEGLAWLIVATKSGAVSEAEVQVRDRLAQKPVDLKAAEVRAGELLGNLPAATVRAVLKGAAAPTAAGEASKVPPAPVIAPPIVKPVITPTTIDPILPPKIAVPPIPPPSLQLPDKR